MGFTNKNGPMVDKECPLPICGYLYIKSYLHFI